MKSMTGKRSRNKGKRGEREAAHAVSKILGIQAKRRVQYAKTTDSPDICSDLQGVHFEVKLCERLSLWAAIAQAVEDCGTKVPVVLHRANRKPWLMILRLEDLPRLIAQINRRQQHVGMEQNSAILSEPPTA